MVVYCTVGLLIVIDVTAPSGHDRLLPGPLGISIALAHATNRLFLIRNAPSIFCRHDSLELYRADGCPSSDGAISVRHSEPSASMSDNSGTAAVHQPCVSVLICS